MKRINGLKAVPAQKIMIADDDKELLNVLKLLLEINGYKVQVFLNAEGMGEMIGAEKPDVILLDVQMEGIDGSDICKILKQNDATANIPIILISANENLEDIARWCGADEHLSKPFDEQDILGRIDHVLTAKAG